MKYIKLDSNNEIWVQGSTISSLFNRSNGWAGKYAQRHNLRRKKTETKTAHHGNNIGHIWLYNLNDFYQKINKKNQKNT